MAITTFEAIVENGQIRLPATVRLPERARVFVVVPGVEARPGAYVGSPRLARAEQAVDFAKEVDEERPGAAL
jgi:hypothetical protein